MNVVLTEPIVISISSAKLVLEEGSTGTIEFTYLDQPLRLNIESTSYAYDIEIAVNDRVQLVESYSSLAANSKGIVQEIIPNVTEDRAKVLFDEIYPDQVINSIETHVITANPSVLVELPLGILEKI